MTWPRSRSGSSRHQRYILGRAHRWNDWRNGIQCVLDSRRTGAPQLLRFSFVDTSEVVEYLLPSSVGRTYPTRLDLSLEKLFSRDDLLYVLGPHGRELSSTEEGWKERARLALKKIDFIRSEYDAIRSQVTNLGKRSSRRIENELIELVLHEKRFLFGDWQDAIEKLDRLWNRLRHRLRIPSAADLSLPSEWRLPNIQGRVEEWFELLCRSGIGHGGPAANRIDAYALAQLEAVNEALPGDKIAVLYTHSGKIWEAVTALRSDGKKRARLEKEGIWIVQPPQVALVAALLEEASSEGERSAIEVALTEQFERSDRIGKLLEETIRRNLFEDEEIERDAASVRSHSLVNQALGNLLGEVARNVKELDQQWQNWEGLKRLRDSLGESEEGVRGILQEVRGLLRKYKREDRERLRHVLKEKLDEIIVSMSKLQQRTSTLLPPPPPGSALSFEPPSDEAVAVFVSPTALGISRAGKRAIPSAAYPSTKFRFRDARVRTFISQFEKIIQREKEEGESDQLTTLLYRSEVELQGEPEFFLLLAAIYSSRSMWFQAYDAAEQGLRALWSATDGEPVEVPEPSREQAAGTWELLVAKAVAARNWTLASYVDLPGISTRFLAGAADLCCRCLVLQKRWSSLFESLIGSAGGVDPRCVRELAVIYGCCWESGIEVKLNADCLREVGVEARGGAGELLWAFEALGRYAYEQREVDAGLSEYYLNTHLYSLSEVSVVEGGVTIGEEEVAYRRLLGEELERALTKCEDPNFRDTLAWHYHSLAMWARRKGQEYQELAERAVKMIEVIDLPSLTGNLYYERLIAKHRREILGMWGSVGR